MASLSMQVARVKRFSSLLEWGWDFLVIIKHVFDTLGSLDILYIIATRASPIQLLLNIIGYHWFSACKEETQSSSGVRESSGVACFTRDSIG
jgi:hypothetical protein